MIFEKKLGMHASNRECFEKSRLKSDSSRETVKESLRRLNFPDCIRKVDQLILRELIGF